MFAMSVTQSHGQKEWAGAKLYPPFGKTCIVCSKRDMLALNEKYSVLLRHIVQALSHGNTNILKKNGGIM